MTDAQVAEALKSDARLVLVEAPAGFGKTFQGAGYASQLTPKLGGGRALILTHTHAAKEVFATRAGSFRNLIETRTIHSLIIEVATAYHSALSLPSNVALWAHQNDGFDVVARKVADLFSRSPGLAQALARRYRYLVCDEHQDASEAQHNTILELHRAGITTRIFGDPMQAIYHRNSERPAWASRWAALEKSADIRVELTVPHRWKNSSPELGDWIRDARTSLKSNQPIDLRNKLPKGLTVIRADNSAMQHGSYMLSREDRVPIDAFVNAASEAMILAPTNELVLGLRSFFNRAIPVWEGHQRDALSALTLTCDANTNNPAILADACISFIQAVAIGFSDGAFAEAFKREIQEGCSAKRRKKPATIQAAARLLLENPNHIGVSRVISRFRELADSDPAFGAIKIDLFREMREAERLGGFTNATEAHSVLTAQRASRQGAMPPKVLSTIHKAKGLEKEAVLLLPCDVKHFPDSESKRCLLYVALSRPIQTLAVVIPRNSPSPLFVI